MEGAHIGMVIAYDVKIKTQVLELGVKVKY